LQGKMAPVLAKAASRSAKDGPTPAWSSSTAPRTIRSRAAARSAK
jgi:hypothetical protein